MAAQHHDKQLAIVPLPIPNDVVGDDVSRPPRLPRWTRQEILVLIQGKRVAESRARRGGGPEPGPGQPEPKWNSVSSYCSRHGVNRGPVQCRKRWSNLAGDFKKIKEWESKIQNEAESYWVMRNDLRRERKLPGFFDKEVYDILDGSVGGGLLELAEQTTDLTLAIAQPHEEEEDTEVVFDSGRSVAAGLFTDSAGNDETMDKDARETLPAPVPISEKQYRPISPEDCPGSAQGTTHEKRPTSSPDTRERRKRKRFTTDGDDEMSSLDHLIEVLEQNGRLLNSQLEAQNANARLDREQRNNHMSGLLSVFNKLADAMVRIADKL